MESTTPSPFTSATAVRTPTATPGKKAMSAPAASFPSAPTVTGLAVPFPGPPTRTGAFVAAVVVPTAFPAVSTTSFPFPPLYEMVNVRLLAAFSVAPSGSPANVPVNRVPGQVVDDDEFVHFLDGGRGDGGDERPARQVHRPGDRQLVQGRARPPSEREWHRS